MSLRFLHSRVLSQSTFFSTSQSSLSFGITETKKSPKRQACCSFLSSRIPHCSSFSLRSLMSSSQLPRSSSPSTYSLPVLILPSLQENDQTSHPFSCDGRCLTTTSQVIEKDLQHGNGSSSARHAKSSLSLYKNSTTAPVIGEDISGSSFLDTVDVLLFDCDGVLWHGDQLLPGIRNLLESLQHTTPGKKEQENTRIGNGTTASDTSDPKGEDGKKTWKKRFYFLTNNSTKSRKGFLKKLESLGFPHVEEEQVICTSYVAACFLDERRQELRDQKRKNMKDTAGNRMSVNSNGDEKQGSMGTTTQHEQGDSKESAGSSDCLDDSLVYVIGEQGLLDELQAKGFTTIGGPSDNGQMLDFAKNKDLAVDYRKDVGTVLVGLDRGFNYYKLQYAQLCLNFNKGSLFLATNRDGVGNFTPSQVWAGAGGMVSAVEAVTKRKATVIGKPSYILREFILRHVLGDTPLDRVCLIGDRLDTDIHFAQRLGVRSVLALTGVTDMALLQKQIEIRESQSKVSQLSDHRHHLDESAASSFATTSKKTPAACSHRQAEGEPGDSTARERRLDVDPGKKGNVEHHEGKGMMRHGHEVGFIIPDFIIETAAHLVL
ncbi:had family iia protein [Cystoisospora suis]|uniref:Had family iia protein n=1 Tax=Cystoisospora suis TaxID=483139 RepID=A0A2C6LBK4_9APIC|nr:had family iia protein [Cystoisospora suis]